MSERLTRMLLVVVAALLAANLLNLVPRSADAQPMGNVAKLPTHGACIGVIAQADILYRAFADGTVEAYRIGSRQPDWRPISSLTLPAEKK